MTMRRIATVALTILGVTGPFVWAQARGQNPPPASPAQGAPAASRADAYYNVTMGHLYQQEFENGGHAEDAAKAIDFYKKAYALDPNSPEIGEDLAEIYFLSHRSGMRSTKRKSSFAAIPTIFPRGVCWRESTSVRWAI